MKRSEALQPLSRDHHHALVAAQRLRRAEDAGEGAARFLEFWREHGEAHFRVEEEVLMPHWALLGSVQADAAEQLSREHLEIRSATLRLEVEEPSLAELHRLGEQLAAHVRFEEEELFPLIEDDLGDEQLERLASAVAAAEELRSG